MSAHSLILSGVSPATIPARRAAPLPLEQRRAAVLAATVPLLRERGAQVSTRELAEAAGVAEGTLFRVFPDKRALVQAALAAALDPAPLEAALARIDLGAPLAARVTRVVELLAERADGIIGLMTALHEVAEGDHGSRPHGGPWKEHEARDARVLAAVALVLEPDAGSLRVTPMQAAGLLRGAVLGERMARLPSVARLTPAQVARCLTSGLVAPGDARAGS